MRENLASFLADVGTDPDLLAALTANPDNQLQNAHLSDEERAAVLTRNSRRISDVLNVQWDAQSESSNFAPFDEPLPSDAVPKKRKAPARRKKTPTSRRKKAPKAPKRKAPRKGGKKTPSRSRKTGRTRR